MKGEGTRNVVHFLIAQSFSQFVTLHVLIGCKKYVSVWSRLREAFEAVPLPQGLALAVSQRLDVDVSGSSAGVDRSSANRPAGESIGDMTRAPATSPPADSRLQQPQQLYPSAHAVARALANPQAHQRALAASAIAAAAAPARAEDSAQSTDSALSGGGPAPVPVPDSSEC